MKPSGRYLWIFLIVNCLGGCTNGYEQFYKPTPGLANSLIHVQPFSGEPRLASNSGDVKRDIRAMYEQGYVLWWLFPILLEQPQNQSGAIAQAKKVRNVMVVLISSKYQNTVSGALPLTLPTATTSYSSGTVNAFGSGGSATGNYSGMTTTYGTQTTYIPYSIDKYEQAAFYFAPLERAGFGVMLNPLTDDERRQLGTNQGVQIVAVRNKSPAFKADVLPGDVILQVGSTTTYDVPTALRAFASAAGGDANVMVARGGERITKKIAIPSEDW